MSFQNPILSPATGLPDPQANDGAYDNILLQRFLAWVFDVAIIFTLTFAICIFTLGLGFFIFAGIWAVTGFLYRFLMLAAGSSTLGMRIMGVEFRGGDGQPLNGLTALLHTLGTAICFATGFQIISVLLMIITDRRQGLPDIILSTAMINMYRFRLM